jgi:uncharacterized SAM-dependent methyltransferase
MLGPADALLFAVDACQEPEKVHRAYNDNHGVTHQFTLNGLVHANELLGYEAFNMADWEAVGRYDVSDGKHQAFVVPKRDTTVEGVTVRKDEKIRIEESYKYSPTQLEHLWRQAGVIEASSWTNTMGDYSKLHIVRNIEGNPTAFSLTTYRSPHAQ